MSMVLMIGLCLSAIVTWLAVARGWKRVEYAAKPLVIILLLAWLVYKTGLDSLPRACFGLGLLFSLAGDVLVMVSYSRLSNRWFMAGLASFLLAHLAYIAGLNSPIQKIPALWGIVFGTLLALAVVRLLRRVLDALVDKKLNRLVLPVMFYGLALTIMLLSAILTGFRSDWKPDPVMLVVSGAVLFTISDVILAWNKFVKPIRRGRLWTMILYHFGQVALIAGAILQFGR
jgi:uncharacterized membrane protein YhhN